MHILIHTLTWLWFTSEIINTVHTSVRTVSAINILEYSCLGSTCTVIVESKKMPTHVSYCIIFSLNQLRIPPVFCTLRAKNEKVDCHSCTPVSLESRKIEMLVNRLRHETP